MRYQQCEIKGVELKIKIENVFNVSKDTLRYQCLRYQEVTNWYARVKTLQQSEI